ncbi:tRNA-modifying protein YgfZ [Ditylenchus destructor]|nr:tRNA-modifying protein YgfZ [Ditylenchus destructor]
MLSRLKLASRALLRISGNETAPFLQGLVTQNVLSLNKPGTLYALLLNVKGRIVFDLLIYQFVNAPYDHVILETDAKSLPQLEKVLKVYRLRKKVQIEPIEESVYFSAPDQTPPGTAQTNVFEDPRVPGFGYRQIGKDLECATELTEDDYLRRRIEWGIGEGEELCDQIPLNMNGDIMNGIDFNKGCYIGQELVARSHFTGVIRRRVLPFHCSETDVTSTPKKIVGTMLFDDQKKKQGKILKTHKSIGLALLSLNTIGQRLFDEAGNAVEVSRPKWWPKDA